MTRYRMMVEVELNAGDIQAVLEFIGARGGTVNIRNKEVISPDVYVTMRCRVASADVPILRSNPIVHLPALTEQIDILDVHAAEEPPIL